MAGEDILLDTQSFFDHWEGGVKATGGAVHPHPEKSYWSLVDFKWTGTQWVYRTKHQMDGEMTVKNATGEDAL